MTTTYAVGQTARKGGEGVGGITTVSGRTSMGAMTLKGHMLLIGIRIMTIIHH